MPYTLLNGGVHLEFRYAGGILINWNQNQLRKVFFIILGTFITYAIATLLSSSHPVSFTFSRALRPSLIFLLVSIPVAVFTASRLSGAFCTLIQKPSRTEFTQITHEILFHEEFMKLRDFYHHTHHIYDHVVRVAFLSYSAAKLLGLDYVSAARGGLLHDFFLYDWRERKETDGKRSQHGKEHPHIALENSRKHFSVNEKEHDIIVKHMFPKAGSMYRYSESFIVSTMDKVSTVYEYFRELTTRS